MLQQEKPNRRRRCRDNFLSSSSSSSRAALLLPTLRHALWMNLSTKAQHNVRAAPQQQYTRGLLGLTPRETIGASWGGVGAGGEYKHTACPRKYATLNNTPHIKLYST